MRFTEEVEFNLPIRSVCCPFCQQWVTIDGLTLMETLWMHEYDCEAIAKDWELQAAA